MKLICLLFIYILAVNNSIRMFSAYYAIKRWLSSLPIGRLTTRTSLCTLLSCSSRVPVGRCWSYQLAAISTFCLILLTYWSHTLSLNHSTIPMNFHTRTTINFQQARAVVSLKLQDINFLNETNTWWKSQSTDFMMDNKDLEDRKIDVIRSTQSSFLL